jgi:CheY-like chemotaxis protein
VTSMRVLVCDDDAATRFVIRRLLVQSAGCTVTECGDGVEALGLLDAGGVDLLILDIDMPLLDGIEVLEAVRHSSRLQRLAVVMLSQERREDVIVRLIRLGIRGYVLKPPRADKFMALIESVRRSLRPQTPAAERPATSVVLSPDSPAMLVEGNLDYRHFFVSQTERHGPIIQAESGAAALALYRQSRASLVFIGSGLGIVSPGLLAAKLRAESAGQPLRLVGILDPKAEAVADDVFDDVIQRTFLPVVHAREIQPYVTGTVGPLAAVVGLAGDLSAAAQSAVTQIFGMMLDAEVEVLIGEIPPTDWDSFIDIVLQDRFVVSAGVHLSDAACRTIAARMRQTASEAITDDDLRETAAEVVNLVTGRLHALFGERELASRCGLPRTDHHAAAPLPLPDEDAGFTLALAVPTLGVSMALTVAIGVREAGQEAGEEGVPQVSAAG